jgi:crotonobetainyl-CoA:carnitine CoA-transferase CaiB-like acyl-CoA transferase
VVQGVSGIAGLALKRDGTPRYVPLLICDHTVGEITATAVSAALYKRLCDGVGSVIEVPMFETMAAYVLQEHMGPTTFDPPLGLPGDSRVLDAFTAPVQTEDGWISLSANTNAQAANFLKAIGRPELVEDNRFASVAARFTNATAWFELRSSALRKKTTAHWLKVFAESDVPSMICHTLESLQDDSHLKRVGLVTQREHVTEGSIAEIRSSILTEGATLPLRHCAQPLGWDTRSVLEEYGVPLELVEQMLNSGAACDGRNPIEASK